MISYLMGVIAALPELRPLERTMLWRASRTACMWLQRHAPSPARFDEGYDFVADWATRGEHQP